jgi:quinol monooxygenase YgiN
MTQTRDPLPSFLAEPSRIGQEISVTGKWTSLKRGRLFWKSAESKAMLKEWEAVRAETADVAGALSTEIHHAVGGDALLVHQVFESPDAVAEYYSTIAADHMSSLAEVAEPQLHLVRGVSIPAPVRETLSAGSVPGVFGELLFGYVKNDYRRPDPGTAIQVTAKWTCTPGESSHLEELTHWWQRVGTDAHSLEEGLLRFEAYQVAGEDALIIHETFADTRELKFHLTKGTAAKYKKEIDRVATPEAYFFRGPVSLMIRTYSKFLRLPATYSNRGSHFTRPGGNMSDGTTA